MTDVRQGAGLLTTYKAANISNMMRMAFIESQSFPEGTSSETLINGQGHMQNCMTHILYQSYTY